MHTSGFYMNDLLKPCKANRYRFKEVYFQPQLSLLPADSVLLSELIPDLHILGYQVEPFGNHTFIIQGSPADVPDGNEKDSLEKILEQYKHFNMDISFSKREKLFARWHGNRQ